MYKFLVCHSSTSSKNLNKCVTILDVKKYVEKVTSICFSPLKWEKVDWVVSEKGSGREGKWKEVWGPRGESFVKSEGPLMIERDYQRSQWAGKGGERKVKR